MKRGCMSLLGAAITKKDKKGKGSLFVEYHECDACGAEYRLYFRSEEKVEDAFQALAKRMGNKPGQEDLCFNCQNKIIADQPRLPLQV